MTPTNEDATPSNVARSLKGIPFPSSKDELFAFAGERNSEEAVLLALSGLPEGEYACLEDVLEAIGSGHGA